MLRWQNCYVSQYILEQFRNPIVKLNKNFYIFFTKQLQNLFVGNKEKIFKKKKKPNTVSFVLDDESSFRSKKNLNSIKDPASRYRFEDSRFATI